jgi:hypothetical protein
MPSPSQEQLRKAESSLRGILAEKGETMDPLERKRVRKRLRRAQRKRRRISVVAERVAANEKKAAEASTKDTPVPPIALVTPAAPAPAAEATDGSPEEGPKSDE